MLRLYYDPIYSEGIHPEARFPRHRYALLAERLRGHPKIWLRAPRSATREDILTVHDEAYADAFLAGNLPDNAVRKIGLRPWTPSIIPRTLRLLGGSLCALEEVLTHGQIIAGNLAGGTHHAFRGEGAGYCIFNDLAICALRALERPSIRRVLILDLDVHQGDGTAALFAGHPDVFTASFHGQKNFPFRKQQSDLDVAFPDQTSDCVYLDVLENTLSQLGVDRFDLVLYQAGVDGLTEDRLGRLRLSRAGLDRRNRLVFDACAAAGLPLVLFMGGGYADPIAATLDAFTDLFSTAAEYVE